MQTPANSEPVGRRRLLGILAGATAVGALGPLAGCGPSEPLRVAVQPWYGYQFLFLGRGQGWLPPAEVSVLETSSVRESVQALAEGRVDAAALTLDEVLKLRDAGTDLCVVLVFDVSAGADAVLGGPGINSPAELAGRRIGVESSALGAIMLASLLQSGGLKREEVSVVPIGEDHFAAWRTGALDAVVTYAPSLGRLEELGLRRIFDTRSVPQLIFDTLAVRAERMKRHHDNLHTLTQAHFRALSMWFENPVDTAQWLAARLGTTAPEVKAVYVGLELPDATYNLHYLAPPSTELNRAAETIGGILAAEGMLSKPLVLQGLFSDAYIGAPDP